MENTTECGAHAYYQVVFLSVGLESDSMEMAPRIKGKYSVQSTSP